MDGTSSETQLLAAYDDHADALFRFCYVFLGERERARDAVQETFTRAWSYLVRGRKIADMKPFLYRTARNLLTDWSRRPRTQSLQRWLESGSDVADDRQDVGQAVSAAHAASLVARLEPAYREAVVLRYLEGLAPHEIASLTGLTENAASVRVHRGIQQLRDLIGITS